MKTFSEVIEAFGGPAKFAAAIGVSSSHAGVMKLRGSIPPVYWPSVVSAAQQLAIEGVSFETLASLAARKRPEPASTSPGVA